MNISNRIRYDIFNAYMDKLSNFPISMKVK